MTNDELIGKVKKNSLNLPQNILDAMSSIDRAIFIPGMYRISAYRDQAVPIGDLQNCSQPSVVALMAQLLEFKPGDKVLEIGMGSGYSTAVTFKLIQPEGELTTIERIRKMCAFGQHNLKQYFAEDMAKGKLKILHENGVAMSKKFQPASFDKIYFTAGVKNIKFFDLDVFIPLLKPQGLILIPEEEGSIFVYTKSQRDKPFLMEERKGFKFVELKSGKA